MSRRLHNWSYDNVVRFLKENGFNFHKEVGGSHEAWIKPGTNGAPDTIVGVNASRRSYPIGTMKRMIRESGIPEAVCIKWGNS